MSWDSCSLMYLAIVASFRPTVDKLSVKEYEDPFKRG